MSQAELSAHGNALLLKIHVITGWIVPQKEMLTVLVDQFQKKMLESYPNCTVSEIEFAFRQYGKDVRDWGKQLNISLVDEVMGMYLNQRLAMSRFEESQKKPVQKIYSEEELLNMQRGDMEACYQRMLSGRQKEIPGRMKAILVADGFLTEEQSIAEFLVDLINRGVQNLYARV